jgi:hypothetical protein
MKFVFHLESEPMALLKERLPIVAFYEVEDRAGKWVQCNGRQTRLFSSFLPVPQRHIIGRDHDPSGCEEWRALRRVTGNATPRDPKQPKPTSRQD